MIVSVVVAAEGFCDRRYDASGHLVARGEPGALLEDPVEAAAQARHLVLEGVRIAEETFAVSSLCVHSDSPGAPAILAAVRASLDEEPSVLVARR